MCCWSYRTCLSPSAESTGMEQAHRNGSVRLWTSHMMMMMMMCCHLACLQLYMYFFYKLVRMVSSTLLVLLQPSASVKAGIRFRLVVFSSLFLSLNIDLDRDDDRQDDRLKVPPSSSSASNASPQPVSNCFCMWLSLLIRLMKHIEDWSALSCGLHSSAVWCVNRVLLRANIVNTLLLAALAFFELTFCRWLPVYCSPCPCVGPGCVLCTRIDPLRFLAGCRRRRLNQA